MANIPAIHLLMLEKIEGEARSAKQDGGEGWDSNPREAF
jgi:hypothetical protein